MIDGIRTVAEVILWLIVSHPMMVILPLITVGAVVHCVRSCHFTKKDKTLWVALLILLTPASLIAYVIVNGMKRRENQKSNQASHATSDPAPGAASSSREG